MFLCGKQWHIKKHIRSSDSKILGYFQQIKLGSRRGFVLSLPAILGLSRESRDKGQTHINSGGISSRGLLKSITLGFRGILNHTFSLNHTCSLGEEGPAAFVGSICCSCVCSASRQCALLVCKCLAKTKCVGLSMMALQNDVSRSQMFCIHLAQVEQMRPESILLLSWDNGWFDPGASWEQDASSFTSVFPSKIVLESSQTCSVAGPCFCWNESSAWLRLGPDCINSSTDLPSPNFMTLGKLFNLGFNFLTCEKG